MTRLKLPIYLELDGKVAAMVSIADGRSKASVPKGYSFADFMERGVKITEARYQGLLREEAKDKAVS